MAASRKKKKKGAFGVPTLIAAVIIAVTYVIALALPTEQPATPDVPETHIPAAAAAAATADVSSDVPVSDDVRYEIPRIVESRSEQQIEHLAYVVNYNHDWHLPNWVAYCLTGSEVDGDFTRTDKFVPDPLVDGDPVVTKDYSGSGYDRGHMAPAADMRWSEQAMRESFYMTNMCPQNHNNNAGDWKDLEELVRDIARRYGPTYICAGPIVTDVTRTIGTVRKIVVPSSFYKVLLRQKTDGAWTAIGFVMPNEAGNRPLMTYMRSVDEVEAVTGIDFFPCLPDSVESRVESDFVVSDWTLSR